MSDFDYALQKTLAAEGGYVFDESDPGGETKFGISKRAYPQENIRTLTLQRAKEIYYQDFWIPLSMDKVGHTRAAAEIFDTAVHVGKRRAIRITQRALNYLGAGLVVDGVIGKKTIAAINRSNRRDAEAVLKILNVVQGIWYIELVERRPRFRVYAWGWLKRISVT